MVAYLLIGTIKSVKFVEKYGAVLVTLILRLNLTEVIESASWMKVSCKPTSENAVGFIFKTEVLVKVADTGIVDWTKVTIGIVWSWSSNLGME